MKSNVKKLITINIVKRMKNWFSISEKHFPAYLLIIVISRKNIPSSRPCPQWSISFSFLESLESICIILPTALACLDSNEELGITIADVVRQISSFFSLVSAIQRLTDWTLKLMNIEYIMEKQFTQLEDTLLKIRMIKCGLRLCGHLSSLTEILSEDWIVSSNRSQYELIKQWLFLEKWCTIKTFGSIWWSMYFTVGEITGY